MPVRVLGPSYLLWQLQGQIQGSLDPLTNGPGQHAIHVEAFAVEKRHFSGVTQSEGNHSAMLFVDSHSFTLGHGDKVIVAECWVLPRFISTIELLDHLEARY